MGGVLDTVENVTGVNVSGNSAADQALRAQQGAASSSNAMQQRMYDQAREDLGAYRDAGGAALSTLASGNFMNNFKGDPGFQFRMNEGMKALQGSAAAKGSLNSGATLKALTRYGQDFASNEYANAYGREFGRLSQLANMGQNSAAQTASAGQNYANAFGQNTQGAANAQAAQATAQAGQTAGLLQGGMTAAALKWSDRRLKTNIRNVDPSDIAELRKAIKPCHFQYVAEQYGEGDWIGIMAQDIEKTKLGRTVVVEDHAGRKMVNMQKLLCLLVATFGEEAA